MISGQETAANWKCFNTYPVMGANAMIIEVIMLVLALIQPRVAGLARNGLKKFLKVSIFSVISRFTEVILWLKETYAFL